VTTELTSGERQDRRFRRAMRVGIVASLLLHALLFLLFHDDTIPLVPQAAAGPDADDDIAAAGGSLETVNLRIAEPQPIPRPPEPVFVPDVLVPVEPQPQVEVEPVDLAVLGRGTGEPAETPGAAGATGEGDAGTSEAGRARVVPPNPRGIIMPPGGVPRNARGRTFTVYVFVDARGRVVSDSTRLIPTSGNGRWDRGVIERANEWVFEPARRDGRTVAEWWSFEFDGT
jgi:hypothetical protein